MLELVSGQNCPRCMSADLELRQWHQVEKYLRSEAVGTIITFQKLSTMLLKTKCGQDLNLCHWHGSVVEQLQQWAQCIYLVGPPMKRRLWSAAPTIRKGRHGRTPVQCQARNSA